MRYREFNAVDVQIPTGLAELAKECFDLDTESGFVFYNPNGQVVVCTGESGDDYEDELREKFDMIDEIEDVSFERDVYAPQDAGWVVMLPSQNGWKAANWSDGSEIHLPVK